VTRPLPRQINRPETMSPPSLRRRNRSITIILACITLVFSVALTSAQSGPAFRYFQTSSTKTFRIALRIRTEIEGQKPSPVGAKTFLQPVNTWLEQNLSWQATRTVLSLSSDGTATIEEKLNGFSESVSSSDDAENKEKLLADLESSLAKWNTPKTLQYLELRTGQISGLAADSVPPLGESAPRVLTAWLVRALRPTAALPVHPLTFGQHWQEPRAVEFSEWSSTTGSEAGEWIGAPAGVRQRGEPTVKLQTTQEISGSVSAGAEKPAEGSASAHFHAESLSTLALDDLQLRSASRTATRDIVWTLAPVEGLAKPPQYRGRLFVEISIQVCDENPCAVVNGNSGHGSR
jgi:hypothetical protein